MKKILLVDDEPDILDLVETFLGHKIPGGLMAVKKSNGLDAFLACQQVKFDLIITDQMMPIMTGIGLITALRTRQNLNTETGVIMLSGFLDDSIKEKLKEKKISFLSKPFDEKDFAQIISEYF